MGDVEDSNGVLSALGKENMLVGKREQADAGWDGLTVAEGDFEGCSGRASRGKV